MPSRLLLLLASLLSVTALAGEVADSRAAELAKLRREVETLSSDLGLRKDDLRSRLKAIEAQKVEIEVQIRREELRLAQIEGEAASRREELARHVTTNDALKPAVVEAIGKLRSSVEAGLPYRVPDRLAELDKLRDQLDQGLVTPEAASARLWAFTEDELRLVRENGIDRQIVPVGGAEVLADVARLGMVAMYFRTDAGSVGTVVRKGAAWEWVELPTRDEKKQVETLFEKMKHGVKSGAFLLPNPGSPR